MKISASLHLLPFEVEDILKGLGKRVSAARRARGLTQPDLAAKAGISLSTVLAIEKGAPTVQFGFWLSVLWSLDLLEGFHDLTRLGRDDDSYRDRVDAVALDPVHLPLTRSRRPMKETRQGGLFGVIRDASPEGFGLALLERLKATTLADPLARLELSEGDAVGAIEVCDDIAAKRAYAPPTAQALFDVLARLPAERPSSQAAREVKGIQGTSLGGERPKLTVLHQGQHWIAKLTVTGGWHRPSTSRRTSPTRACRPWP